MSYSPVINFCPSHPAPPPLAWAVGAGVGLPRLCPGVSRPRRTVQRNKAALIEPGMPALQSLPLLRLGSGVDIGHVQGLERMVQQQLADQVIDAQVSSGGARGFSEVVAGPLLAR